MPFRKAVTDSFEFAGWTRRGKLMTFCGQDADVLVDIQHGFGRQWFCNVGFDIHELSAIRAAAVHKTALYFRLERLFPAEREMILTAGSVDDAENTAALQDLKRLIADVVSPHLMRMTNLDVIREHYRAGSLSHGLVTLAAQRVLQDAPRAAGSPE